MPYSLCWHLLIKENRAIIKGVKELKEVKQTKNFNQRSNYFNFRKTRCYKRSQIFKYSGFKLRKQRCVYDFRQMDEKKTTRLKSIVLK